MSSFINTNKGHTVSLCTFRRPLTPWQTFERTASYARNPSEYLVEALGPDIFAERRAHFILSTIVDMDIYGSGQHKEHFELKIAELFGKKSGLFFITGTQAQLAALKIYTERTKRRTVAWHVTSHLESAEEQAYCRLYGLERRLIGNDPGQLPSIEVIRALLDSPPHKRPAAIVLEIPNRALGCVTYTFAELEEISFACRAANVALHCDGARIWEIEAYYAATSRKTFQDVAALFDSVYVSLYKALEGITGAMLLHNDSHFVEEARVWQKRAGGNAYTLAYNIIDCERGFNESIGSFASRREKMIRIVKQIRLATVTYQNRRGESMVTFQPRTPTCSQVLTYFHGFREDQLFEARDQVQRRTNVRVFERLRSNLTTDELSASRRKLSENQKCTSAVAGESSNRSDGGSYEHFIEWRITSVTHSLNDRIFVDAYVEFCEELRKLLP